MKRIQVNYLLLPLLDNSHIQEFIYKVSSAKGNCWKKGTLPKIKFKFKDPGKVIEEFISPGGITRAKECKIVRKNVRTKKSKST